MSNKIITLKLFRQVACRSPSRTCCRSCQTETQAYLDRARADFLLRREPVTPEHFLPLPRPSLPSPCWGARWGQGQEVCVSWGARRGGRFDCRARAGEASRWETGINNAAPQEGATSVWVNPQLDGSRASVGWRLTDGFVRQLFYREGFMPRQQLQPFIMQFCRFSPKRHRWNLDPEIRLWQPPFAGTFSGSGSFSVFFK